MTEQLHIISEKTRQWRPGDVVMGHYRIEDVKE